MTSGDLSPGTLPMSPCSCTADDIPDPWIGDVVPFPMAACRQCGFQFPIMPGIFREITIKAIREHGCHDDGNSKKWEVEGKAVIEGLKSLGLASMGELAQHLQDEQEAAATEGEKLTLRYDAEGVIGLDHARIGP